MKIRIVILIILLILSNTNAQSSPTNCKYNGIDYGFLSNSTRYSSTDSANQYTFYFNVCGTSNKCNPMNIGSIAACQIKNGGTNPTITALGMIGQGTFGINNNQVVLNYKTSTNPCSSGSFRNINIYLVQGNTFSVSQTIEESKCQYGITLTYPSSSSSSSSSDNYNNSTVICKKIENGIIVESESSIICTGYGPIKCIGSNNSICFTDQENSITSCGTTNSGNGNNEISCFGKSIECISEKMSCKINSQNNNKIIKSLNN